jgi:hypothetical protein
LDWVVGWLCVYCMWWRMCGGGEWLVGGGVAGIVFLRNGWRPEGHISAIAIS